MNKRILSLLELIAKAHEFSDCCSDMKRPPAGRIRKCERGAGSPTWIRTKSHSLTGNWFAINRLEIDLYSIHILYN